MNLIGGHRPNMVVQQCYIHISNETFCELHVLDFVSPTELQGWGKVKFYQEYESGGKPCKFLLTYFTHLI